MESIKQLAENIGIETEEFVELFDLFIQTSVSDMNALKAAIEHRHYDHARDIIHSIKGAALNLALYNLHDRLDKLSSAVKENLPHDISRNLRILENIMLQYIEINKNI